MCYVYILQSLKDGRTYTGFTKDFDERIKRHNEGRARSTGCRRPFRVLLVERFGNLEAAKAKERWWKSSSGRKKMKNFFKA